MVQFKLLSGSGASIASLLTIGQALKLIYDYINNGEKANIIIDNIKKNVFSEAFDKASKQGLLELLTDVEKELLPLTET